MSRSWYQLTWREGLMVLIVVIAALVAILFPMWRAAVDRSRSGQTAEPFRIAGDLYYVGGSDATSFLLTGPEGHVVIDGGHVETAPMIIASIARLGFAIKDVKVLLNTEPREQAAGLAALQAASGAELWASEASAAVIASGGKDPELAMPLRAAGAIGIFGYPPARVDHRFKDGDTIRVGPIALTAHITAGATRGCTSWSFAVRDGDRLLNVVDACPLTVVLGMRYAQQQEDFENTFRVLRSLPADIWVTTHARAWGRYRKFVESASAKNPVDAFIDRDGYRAFIDGAEADFFSGVVH